MRPTTLSTALWRPTSSATVSSRPSGANSPAACRPPVCRTPLRARADGPAAPPANPTRSVQPPLSTGRVGPCSDSIVRRPHSPHDEFVVTCRRARSAAPAGRRHRRRDVDVDRTVLGILAVGHCRRSRPGPRRRRSDSRNPAASSRSSPGVRITTANGLPVQAHLERLLDGRASPRPRSRIAP